MLKKKKSSQLKTSRTAHLYPHCHANVLLLKEVRLCCQCQQSPIFSVHLSGLNEKWPKLKTQTGRQVDEQKVSFIKESCKSIKNTKSKHKAADKR